MLNVVSVLRIMCYCDPVVTAKITEHYTHDNEAAGMRLTL
jgi:hypothetical protein